MQHFLSFSFRFRNSHQNSSSITHPLIMGILYQAKLISNNNRDLWRQQFASKYRADNLDLIVFTL